jgi:NAD(P)-dependent dehydrogenase (short-subunit alcohol dehydrogenase family)
METFMLPGKIAIVTGGGQGIGRTLALALAQAGAAVAVADIQDEPAQQTAAEIEAAGGCAAALHVDVTSPESVRAMVAACTAQLGGVDILVNNAGIFPIQAIPAISADDWDRVMAVNLKGTFLCAQAVLNPMRQRGGGRIINISSVSGLVGAVGFAHYAASKAGVIGFTKALAREVAAINITANAIAPGIIDTGAALSTFPAQALEMYKLQVPLRSLGHPEDLAGMVVFLASPGAGYITGQTYAVDGGYTMQ